MLKIKKSYSIIVKKAGQKKNNKEEQNMIKAESIGRVYIHTRNLLENKQAKKLALLGIFKTGTKHEIV